MNMFSLWLVRRKVAGFRGRLLIEVLVDLRNTMRLSILNKQQQSVLNSNACGLVLDEQSTI